MKKTARSVMLAGLFSAFLAFAPAQGADNPEAVIKYRQNVMKSQGGHLGAIFAVLKNQLSFQGHIADHAQGIHLTSQMIVGMFPEGSGSGKTQAKPEIWENWSKFKMAAEALQKESAALVTVAQSGDMQAIGKQAQALVKTCSGCHKHFRKRKK